jgi:hypothetical protein
LPTLGLEKHSIHVNFGMKNMSEPLNKYSNDTELHSAKNSSCMDGELQTIQTTSLQVFWDM